MVAKLKTYFSITLTADQETELTQRLTDAGASYDTDGSGGLSLAEMTQFLKDNGNRLVAQLNFLKKAQS